MARAVDPVEYLRFQTTLSPEFFFGQLNVWGRAKTSLLAQQYWLDFIYPFFYGAFLRDLLCWAGRGHRWLWLPMVAAGCDLVENVCQLSLILGWTVSEKIFYAGALAAWAKWGLVGLTLVSFLWVSLSRTSPSPKGGLAPGQNKRSARR